MRRPDFPALGFDPAPGEPPPLGAAVTALRAAAADLTAARDRLPDPAGLGWTGPAAAAAGTPLAALRAELETAATAHLAAAAALDAWAGTLGDLQARAWVLERRAAAPGWP